MVEHKYKNRPDISILVVEKGINPLECEDTRHDISDAAYFLVGYGFTVDLVWTLSKYKFADFNQFCESIIGQLHEEDEVFKDKKYDDVREMFQRHTDKRIEEFRGLGDILRKTPINSVDDLLTYDFLILHPDFHDCDEILPKILEKYLSKPIILPVGSVAGSVSEGRGQKCLIECVIKDTKYENVYCIPTECDFDYKILELIEYLLDKRAMVKK